MNENLNDELSRRPLAIEDLKRDKIFCPGSNSSKTRSVSQIKITNTDVLPTTSNIMLRLPHISVPRYGFCFRIPNLKLEGDAQIRSLNTLNGCLHTSNIIFYATTFLCQGHGFSLEFQLNTEMCPDQDTIVLNGMYLHKL
ncbi:hypothetical protein AVEN_212905-1 [Araneus ventricosus]|uniref:Uncharacterized protein n=1 Tax=Araneus ventricosus TaxID=182803 RepID=A0A4Y2R633_ARAVE|nr:hypothetical protein AVEN_212905-1 [Araneus ventricosus]